MPEAFIWSFMTSVDRIFILRLIGPYDVGIYSLGSKIGLLVLLAVQTFRLAWLPLSMKFIKFVEGKIIFRLVSKFYILIGFNIVLILATFSKNIIRIISTEEYISATYLIGFFALQGVLSSYNLILSIGITKTKKTYLFPICLFIALLINLFFNIVLIPELGTSGAVISTVISYIIWNSMLLFFSEKLWNVKFPIFSIFSSLLITIIGVVLLNTLNDKDFSSILLSFTCTAFVILNIFVLVNKTIFLMFIIKFFQKTYKLIFINNLYKYFNKFISKYGYLGLFRLVLYPIISLYKSPLKSLHNYYNIFKWLFSKKNNSFSAHLSPGWSYLMLYYYSRAEAIFSGRNEIDYLGFGLKKNAFWFYSKVSMYLMKFGTVTIVISVLFIQFSLLFTSYHMNSDYFLISIFLILFSSLVWGIYIRQNYQIIAFAFMPLLLNAHQHDFIFLEIVFSF